MTAAQRRLLERFAAGDRPLNRAIAAALAEVDRLGRADDCPACDGSGRRWYPLFGTATCDDCKGSGRRR